MLAPSINRFQTIFTMLVAAGRCSISSDYRSVAADTNGHQRSFVPTPTRTNFHYSIPLLCVSSLFSFLLFLPSPLVLFLSSERCNRMLGKKWTAGNIVTSNRTFLIANFNWLCSFSRFSLSSVTNVSFSSLFFFFLFFEEYHRV